MIIECVNCYKKFEVNSDLIPDDGRTIQCGSCNHTWFFNKNSQYQLKSKVLKEEISNNDIDIKSQIYENKNYTKKNKTIKNKKTEIIEYKPKANFTLSKFLSYILVFIISMISILIILDTFKSPLFNTFPNLEFLLFSLYETFKDVKLFFINLF